MHLLYNGILQPESEFQLLLSNRAFQYNDGFFETIMLVNGRLRCWQYHLDRMQDAARVLQLDLPESLQEPHLYEQLLQLAQDNNASTFGRIKLKVWRSGAGLYSPETNRADWLATAAPATIPAAVPVKVGICKDLFTSFSPFSFFKGPNSLLYVMAAIQKQAAGTDDMLLLSPDGFVAELISANIFWVKDSTIFTPTLQTGCINGIMRRTILRLCQAAGYELQEVKALPEALLRADAAFAANVTGIKQISYITTAKLQLQHPIVEWLNLQIADL